MSACRAEVVGASQRTPDKATLEKFVEELDAIYEAEMASVGPEDGRAMERLVRLSRYWEGRGRRLLAQAKSLDDVAKGVALLARHHVMEVIQGHSITHGIYDRVGSKKRASRRFVWWTAVSAEDWAVHHNRGHHPFTNQVGEDDDYGFRLMRLSGRTPWRPWHLAQPVVLVGLPFVLTLYFPLYVAGCRARIEGRPIVSRETFAPPIRRILAELRQNYIREPRKAGARFPIVLAGNAMAKLLANAYLTVVLGVDHQAPELLDAPKAIAGESREAFVLRQILATRNFRIDPKLEELFALGVSSHIEHHLFPDLPVHRLRRVEERVAEVCARYGIPHRSGSLLDAAMGTVRAATYYALPFTMTPARRRVRALYDRLVGEFEEVRARRTKDGPNGEPDANTKRRPAWVRLRLVDSGQSLRASTGATLLETLEASGVAPRFGCRRGVCKTCTVAKVSGRTTQDEAGARKTVEICVARPLGDVELAL